MNTLLLLLILSLPHITPAPETDKTAAVEEAIIQRALQCNRLRYTPHPDFLRALLDLEKAFGVPDELRGLTLAAACHESGLNPQVKGDHKCRVSKKLTTSSRRCASGRRSTPKAIGMFQQWVWVENAYGIDRRDPMQAAWAWLTHWQRKVAKAKRDCRFRTPYRQWKAAQVTAIRAPTRDGKARCNEESHHFKRWKRWRRSWRHLL